MKKFLGLLTVSMMFAAFFYSTTAAYDVPDKNYIYVARYNGMDYFLDSYSVKVTKDKPSARSWTQFVFPIGEDVPKKLARSIEQTFYTDGETAYNSSHAKNPIDAIADAEDREFMRRCFEVGYEYAFGEKYSARNLTEVVFILDRSGSMSGMESDTIGGFNAMLDKQKSAEGDAYLTTVLFDDKVEVLHDRLPIGGIKPITGEEYWVRGSTALLDAVGETINHIKKIQKYARDGERPSKTIFCITTDGMENASRHYSYRDIKNLIEQQKEVGWEFLFLGADIDSAEVAERLGIDRSRAANYRKDARGSGLMYGAFADAVTSMRESGAVDDNWKDEVEADERDRQ